MPGAYSEIRLKIIVVTRDHGSIQVENLPSEVIIIIEGQVSPELTKDFHLREVQHELRFKGHDNASLGDSLASSISSVEHLTSSFVDAEVFKLILQRSQLYTCQSIIRQRLLRCQEPEARKVNLQWLLSLDTKLASSEIQRTASNNLLGSLKENLNATFKRAINSLKLKDIVNQVLELLLPFRPLTSDEQNDLIIGRPGHSNLKGFISTDRYFLWKWILSCCIGDFTQSSPVFSQVLSTACILSHVRYTYKSSGRTNNSSGTFTNFKDVCRA